MQKGQTQVLILAGAVLLIALASGIFYLGRVTLPRQDSSGQAAPKPQPQNVVPSSPQPSPTPDETVYTESDRSANWKTYTDKASGYSIRYPTDWEISRDQPSGLPKMISGVNIKKVINPSYVSVIIYNNQENLSIEEFIKKYISSGTYDLSAVEFKPIYLDNVEGKRTKNLPRLTVGEDVFVRKEDKLYHISLNVYGEVGKDTFDQILSTFKFTQ